MTEWQPSVRKLPPDDHLFDEGMMAFRKFLSISRYEMVLNINHFFFDVVVVFILYYIVFMYITEF